MQSKTACATFNEGSTRAAYSSSSDHITLPDLGHFTSLERYYTKLLHELGYWTGHPTRLDRDMSGRFGDEQYAAEERQERTDWPASSPSVPWLKTASNICPKART